MECVAIASSNTRWNGVSCSEFRSLGFSCKRLVKKVEFYGFCRRNSECFGTTRREAVKAVVSDRGPSTRKPGIEIPDWRWRKMMKEIESCGSAVTVINALRIGKMPLPRELLLGILTRFKFAKDWRYVSEVMEWLKGQDWWNFNRLDYNLLMLAYGKQGNYGKAEQTLDSMREAQVFIDVAAYTALIEAYGKAGHSSKALSIFKRMQSSGPLPSVVTYQTMIKILVDEDKFDEAEEIFHSILDDERPAVKPDKRMFHLMIHMYKKIGKSNEAQRLLNEMIARGIPQCTVTFNSLMTGEQGIKRDELFNEVYRSGLRPDVVTYTQLISRYAKARKEEAAQEIFDEMIAAGVKPTHVAFNVLLDAYARSGLVEEAKVVFKRMRKERCFPDLCSYTTMLSAYVNASDMEGAEKFFTRIKADGFVPNAVAYGALIKGYGKESNLEKMVKKYEEMRRKGLKPNVTIYTTLIDAHGRNADFSSAIIWFKEMVSSGCKPDQKAKNILHSLAKTVEEKEEVNELIETLESI